MTELIENWIVGFIFPIELLCAVVVYMLPLSKRKGYIGRFFAGVLIYLAGAVLFDQCLSVAAGKGKELSVLFSADALLKNPVTYTLHYLFVFLAVVGIVLFCCDVTMIDAAHCVAFGYATQHFTYGLYRVVFRVADPTVLDQYHSVGYYVVHIVVYVLFYFIFAKRIHEAKSSGMGDHLSIRYTLATLLVAFILSSCSQAFEQESPSLYVVTLMYAMFCCIVLLYVQLYQFRALHLQNELTLQQHLWQESKAQYELSRENIALINQKCHDLKHQIGALRSMADGAERESKLNELEQSVMIYDSIVETGNNTIDTVLTEKSLICERNQIVLTCIADGECLRFMDTIDLYTIFGNLLDNAIECVRGMENPQKRVISISIFSRADFVFIQCENYYEGELTLVNGMPKSTKTPDGYHGFGINGIKQTVEKYDGFLTLETEGQIFLLRITIPAQMLMYGREAN